MVSVLLEVLLPIALIAGVGFGLRRAMPLDQRTLNRVVIYGLSPALIFASLVRSDLSGTGTLRMIALSVGLVIVMLGVAVICARPFGVRGPVLSALLLSALFMNSGNYGLPAARFAFGEQGFTLALFYFVAQSVLGQTLGIVVAAAGNVQPGTSLLREVLGRLVRMPQVYAVAAALLVRATGFNPETAQGAGAGLYRGVALLGDATLPMMLVILGMQLGTGVTFEHPGVVAFATALRLLVAPLVSYGLGLALGMQGLDLAVGVMLSGMPTAVHTTITALEFDSRPQIVVGSVVASSLGSLATLTVILTLVR